MRRKNSPQQLDLFRVSCAAQEPGDADDVLRVDVTINLQKMMDEQRKTEQAFRMWHLFRRQGRCVARA